MTNLQKLAVFVVLAAIGYVGCGRSDIDEGFPLQPISTGAGGGIGSGSGGSGTGGYFVSGSGGSFVTGSGGYFGTGGYRPDASVALDAPVGSGGGSGSGGSGGRPGTGGSISIGTGGSPGTGGVGTGGAPGGIACGNMTCASGVETCCVQTINGNRTETCLKVGAQCGGANIGCFAGDCSDGSVCCLSIVGLSTGCATPAACSDGLSTVLCRNNNDCPTDRRFCCPAIGINICRAYRCPGN